MVSTRKAPPAMASPLHRSAARSGCQAVPAVAPLHRTVQDGAAPESSPPGDGWPAHSRRRATAVLLRLPPYCRRPPPARPRPAENSIAGWRQSPEDGARSHQTSDCRLPAPGRRARRCRASGQRPQRFAPGTGQRSGEPSSESGGSGDIRARSDRKCAHSPRQRAPRWHAPARRKFGQNSVSARTISRGRSTEK